ncbi:MAG: hypothetical protein ACKVX7_04590 [Planctomycetota bacterium]
MSDKPAKKSGGKCSRAKAAKRVILLYVAVQICSLGVLYYFFAQSQLMDTWLLGVGGPLSHAKTLPNFQLQSLIANIGMVVLSIAVAVLPWMYTVRSNWRTLVGSIVGWSLWTAYGIGFSLNQVATAVGR